MPDRPVTAERNNGNMILTCGKMRRGVVCVLVALLFSMAFVRRRVESGRLVSLCVLHFDPGQFSALVPYGMVWYPNKVRKNNVSIRPSVGSCSELMIRL